MPELIEILKTLREMGEIYPNTTDKRLLEILNEVMERIGHP